MTAKPADVRLLHGPSPHRDAALFRAPGWSVLDASLVVDAAVRAEALGFHESGCRTIT